MTPLLVTALVLSASPASPSREQRFPYSTTLEPIAQQATSLVQSSSVDEARPLADKLVKEAPKNPRGWAIVGWIAFIQEQTDAARTALDRAIQLGLDKDARVHIQRASVELHAQDAHLDVAVSHANRAVQLAPDDTQVLFTAAQVADLNHDGAKAVQRMKRYVELAPQDGIGYARLAQYAANAGDMGMAAEAVAEARKRGQREKFFDTIDRASKSKSRK
jgi:predicted Zn-dependent protease